MRSFALTMTTTMTTGVYTPQFPREAAFAKTQDAALAELIGIQEATSRFGESLTQSPSGRLNARPGEGRWSALECLEHLNRYADHYLPLLRDRVPRAPAREGDAYRPGLLGRPFALAMHPARRAKKLRSPGRMNPLGSTLDAEVVVGAFRQNQAAYLEVLRALRGKELRGSRIPISAFPIVKLHLGDMLHTLVWHHARHVLQAGEAVG